MKKKRMLICFVYLLLEAFPLFRRRRELLLSWYKILSSTLYYPCWASMKYCIQHTGGMKSSTRTISASVRRRSSKYSVFAKLATIVPWRVFWHWTSNCVTPCLLVSCDIGLVNLWSNSHEDIHKDTTNLVYESHIIFVFDARLRMNALGTSITATSLLPYSTSITQKSGARLTL